MNTGENKASTTPQPRASTDTSSSKDAQIAAGLHATADSRVAAFFDLDKTIIAKSSAYAFNKQFLERGIISPTDMLQMALSHALYMSQGHDEAQMEATREQFSALIAGHSARELRQVAIETLEQNITPYIYAEALELIREHRAQGHQVFIISASARQIVEPIAQALGVYNVVATELEVRDGIFTGETEFFCRGENKAVQMRRIAEKRQFDLAECFAYSDSITDEPMLSAVGHPVVVNPDRALRKIATEREWPVRQFRNPVPLFRAPSKRNAAILSGVTLALGAGATLLALRKNDDESKAD
ncbi:HAD family phosphatase [Corynebacterium sp. HMSC14B06]|uniref:HAD family hydrolase n=1 Tax=Corynebacterium sp. HMSC14B06 TaxID=1581098 RepID=UPI0009F20A80|nr:HAD family hydrolase [Corynebacterium sp. HMSC14B06]